MPVNDVKYNGFGFRGVSKESERYHLIVNKS